MHNKTAHTVIVGGDGVSYGRMPEGAKHWREKMLKEVGAKLDPIRTHFLGKVPYAGYKRILQVSAAHVYLTYPFVLSWSMLEAMATGCTVIGSDTAPVREVLDDGVNGRLTNLFDLTDVAERAVEVLRMPASVADQLRQGASERALAYSTNTGNHALEGVIFGAHQRRPLTPIEPPSPGHRALSMRSAIRIPQVQRPVISSELSPCSSI